MKTEIPKWMADEVAEYDLEISPPPKTILDVGANIGAFALHYGKKWPGAEITACEPVTENFLRLKKNTAGIPKMICRQVALRNFNGPSEIFLGDRGVTCGFHRLGRQTDKKEMVECEDAYTFASRELVKIDTEGCELEIIQRLDLSQTRAIVVEYHRPADAAAIITALADKGFSLLIQKPGSTTHGVLKFGLDAGVTLPTKQAAAMAAPSAASPRCIYVAIAGHFSNHDLIFVQSMMALVLQPPVMLRFGWSTDPSVERARNVLTANFLASDCTHILFIDADIGFTPADVKRITSHSEPVVGGIYPLKTMDPEVKWCGNGCLRTATGEAVVARNDGLQEVGCIGTGFMCIAREAFEKILEKDAQAIRYIQDWPPFREEFAFWRQEVRMVPAPEGAKPRFLTEDWNFCYRFRELGGKVFCDQHVILRHAGRAEWPLPLQGGNPFAVKNSPPGGSR